MFHNHNVLKKPSRLHTINEADRQLISWLNLPKYNAIVVGGAARRWFQGHSVGSADIDIFFKNEEGLLDLMVHIATLPPTESFSLGLTSTNNGKSFKSVCNSQQAITYEFTGFRSDGSTIKVQLIKIKIYEDTQALFNTFDISVCMVATDGIRWIVGEHFLQDLANNKLRMIKINNSSVKRLVKYWSYGYIPDDTLLQTLIDDKDIEWNFAKDSDEDYHDT
jgi:hypothetical protein